MALHWLTTLEQTGHVGAVGGSLVGSYVGVRVLNLLARIDSRARMMQEEFRELSRRLGQLSVDHGMLDGRVQSLERHDAHRPRIVPHHDP
jgi:hypothetical protein